MTNTTGTAIWQGGLKDGSGNVSTQSGSLNSKYTFDARFGEDGTGTNPEEIVGAAHAACFSMFLASLLEKKGHKATEIKTTAEVQLSKDETGPFIRKIKLHTEGKVEGIDQKGFEEAAETAKANCPLSRALKSVPEVTLTAVLI